MAELTEEMPMTMTKAAFVVAAEGCARAAIQSYETLLGMGFTKEQALDSVIAETAESASCFAGIGSCAGGGCKHG